VVEPHGERVELRLPVLAVAVEPQRSLEDRPGIEPAPADPAGALLLDEAGPDQHLDVARHRLQRDVERRRQLRDEQVLAIEPRQHRPSDRIGKRGKDAVEQRFFGRLARMYGFNRSHARQEYSIYSLIVNKMVD
jgi:hypothetical protein